jgi:hypothetical protein
VSFLKDHIVTVSVVILLSLILLSFNIPFKKDNYIFDWDQASDYESVASIARGKITLIGPRVTSDTGFFLAPWHYYFLLPFYKLTNESLFMGFWGVLFVQWLSTIASFYLARKWFGTLAGLTVGIFFATSGNLLAWGFMYVPLLSLLFFFACLKTIDNAKLLPLLFLFFGFGCTTYAVFYALGIPLAYVTIYSIFKKKVTWKKLFSGVGLAVLPYTPIIIFDLRHNFLNVRNVLRFAGNQHGQGIQPGYFIHVFLRAIETSWLNRELPTNLSSIVVLLTLVTLIIGTFILFNKKKLFVSLWLFSSLIPMAFYRGNVSEYYYAPVIILIPFFISGLLVRKGLTGKVILILLTCLLIIFRIKDKNSNSTGITLSDKIDIVEKLEKMGTKYSVSYELSLGQDSGYNTVFKKLGTRYIEDGSAQLYTITYPNNKYISGIESDSTGKLTIYKR